MTNTRSEVGAATPAVQALERAGVAFALHGVCLQGPNDGIEHRPDPARASVGFLEADVLAKVGS